MGNKKSKRSKKHRKTSKRGKPIVYLIYLALAFLSLYFFFRAYQYVSNIPEANNLTQEEIYKLTRIGESDIKLVRALKNDAFDSWLYEANDDKVKQLQKKQDIVLEIVEGNIEVSEIDDVIANLKESMDVINDPDIEELYVLYYEKVLPREYGKANLAFQEMTVEDPEDHYQEIFSLLDVLNKVYNQKGMLTVINDQTFKQSVSLIEEIHTNFLEVNQIKEKVSNYNTLNDLMAKPKTRLGMELDEQVYRVNDYLQSKLMVQEFEKKYNELQTNLAANELLIQKSIEVPDLVGLTVKQAYKILNKAKLKVTVQGYTNKSYKNGEKVPESQRKQEEWDDNKQDLVIKQEPSDLEYDYIIQGSTIRLIVENKAIEKKEETLDSNETSTSDSTTTSSSSAEETSSTTSSDGF